MEFGERFPGFSSRQECAMLYWRTSCLDIIAATAWFAHDRTREGICAILSEAVADHARTHLTSSHEKTIGSEIENGGGSDMPAS